MPRSLQPRSGRKPRGTPSKASELPRDVLEEVRRSTRPTVLDDTISRLARAIELLERDDPGAAVVEAEKAKRLSSRSSSVREVFGLALYGVGRWNEALAELKAYKRMTGEVDQNHLIADCLRALGKPAEAVIVAASALADQGRFAEALAYLGRARTREDVAEGYTLRLWYVKGDILEKAGRPEEAAIEFRKILRHDSAAFDVAERLSQLP